MSWKLQDEANKLGRTQAKQQKEMIQQDSVSDGSCCLLLHSPPWCEVEEAGDKSGFETVEAQEGAAGVLFAQDANDIETLDSECKAASMWLWWWMKMNDESWMIHDFFFNDRYSLI